jgi:hypothetical protein
MSALSLVLVTLSAAAPAEPSAVPAAEAQEVRLRPGRELAVSTASQELRGKLDEVTPDVLRLELPEGGVREVPLTRATSSWASPARCASSVPRRHRRGHRSRRSGRCLGA